MVTEWLGFMANAGKLTALLGHSLLDRFLKDYCVFTLVIIHPAVTQLTYGSELTWIMHTTATVRVARVEVDS